MKTRVGNFELELLDEKDHLTSSSIVFPNYDKTFIVDSEYKPNSLIGLRVFRDDSPYSNAIIGSTGGGSGVHKSSQVIQENRIVICCSNHLFCLSIPELDLIWKTEADWATCFEVFEYNEDYIVHGELTISRLDNTGKIIWQNGGADIFTTLEGENDFFISDTHIQATDWEYNKYKFDFDGNTLD
jgi:hypothetical protein